MNDLIARWHHDAQIRGFAASTIYGYRWCLQDFEKYINGSRILEADKLIIRDYVESLRGKGLTTRTIGQRLAALSNFFEWAEFEGLLKKDQTNPVLGVRKRYLHSYKKNSSSERHTHKIITIQEARSLVDACIDIRDQTIVLLLLKTGIRRSELCSLEINDINLAEQSITLKPTAKRTNRVVFFDDETEAYLKRWLKIRESRAKANHSNNNENERALWLSSWGSRVDRGAVVYIIDKAALQCGLHDPSSPKMEDHFSAHCCRHWFTTHLLRSGMPREHVKWLRGDVSREAIDTYFHIDPEDVRRSYLEHVPKLF